MKLQRIIAAMAVAFAASTVVAQNAILQNEYVKAGVNQTTGTLGSGGNTSPGLLYDSTGTGTFNTSYDYLTPGSPFEGFTVKVDGTQYRNNNAGNYTQITGTWTGTPTSSSAVWDGAVAGVFGLRHTYSLSSGQQWLGIQTRIEVTNPVANLYFARYIDPDARAAAGDSSSTDNVRGYSGIPATNVIFSEALASRYALGLYTSQITGTNTGPSNTWSTDPSTYYSGGSYTVGQGDHTIGIAFYSAGLSAGDIVTYNYAYIFGPSAFAASTTAVTSYDPGATFTVTNVGSATSAASGPTETGRSTSTITVSDTTVVNTGLPVITAAVAHHVASEASGRQTIARETTTTTTTPMTRTLVTLDRTTISWSDSTTTTSDSATTTTTSAANSVSTAVANDSFSGRIDQMGQLADLNTGINRSLNMNAFRKDGYRSGSGAVYINANIMNSSMVNGYSANTRIYGIAVEANVNHDWRIGAQYNRVDTTMNGTDSTTTQGKNAAGLYSIYNLDDWIIVNNLGYAENSIGSSRNIENLFYNSHNTSGTDIWLNNRVYTPSLSGFRPFVGYTVGQSTVNGFTERGNIQSYRRVGATNTSTNYGEAGVLFDQRFGNFITAVEASTTTDSFTSASAVLGYAVDESGTISVTGTRQQYNGVGSNIVGVQGIFRF